MRASVVTIGNFDGVHAGHRWLLGKVVELARDKDLSSAVLTFDPHPTRIVAPERAPRLLTAIEERCALIREQGIEEVAVLPFTPDIARLTPEEFVVEILVQRLRAKIVLVGDNFRFGHKQAGDTRLLAAMGPQYGFETRIVDAVKLRGRIVSSSEIRRLIETGSVALAGRLLLRPHALAGEVVAGYGVGSKQTVPTLNLSTSAEVIPANGVYITRTRDLDTAERWNSISNIGFRPTFQGDSLSIETYLLASLDGLTPARISVEFLRRVREERKFESPEALKHQILRDVARAQKFFRRTQYMVGSAAL